MTDNNNITDNFVDTTTTTTKSRRKSNNYFIEDGHFIPQYDYVYDTIMIPSLWSNNDNYDDNNDSENNTNANANTNSPPQPKRMVRYVLKFENLHNDFRNLMLTTTSINNNNNNNNMLMYNYTNLVPLPDERVRPLKANQKKVLSVQNISHPNLRLIEQIYYNDFSEFGYTLLYK